MREQYCYSAWTILLQYVNSDFCLCIVNSCDFTMRWKKKKKKNSETQTHKTRNPNSYYIELTFFFHMLMLVSLIPNQGTTLCFIKKKKGTTLCELGQLI